MEDKENQKWIPMKGVPEDHIFFTPEKEFYGYAPNYPKPIDTNPFNLIEGNENKLY